MRCICRQLEREETLLSGSTVMTGISDKRGSIPARGKSHGYRCILIVGINKLRQLLLLGKFRKKS